MKRIYLSILTIVGVLTVAAGATYAAFSSNATNAANTFSTGSANLQIRNNPTQDWAASYGGENFTNLYPGWSQSYNVYLKNSSNVSITLRIRPELVVNSSTVAGLKDKIMMEFSWGDGSHVVGPWTLSAWETPDNNPYLEPTLAQGAETGPWVVKFSIPTTAGNEIKDANINFDLIFNGIQIL
ncbi:MAG: hypothetical protein ACOX50_04915 [Patescibacteria group bacterium]|jgi:hypothetical protein